MRKIIKKISDFYFSSYREKFIVNWGDDVTKWPINDLNSKNKNLKFDFSFASALTVRIYHENGSKIEGGGVAVGSAYLKLGKVPCNNSRIIPIVIIAYGTINMQHCVFYGGDNSVRHWIMTGLWWCMMTGKWWCIFRANYRRNV